VTSSGAELYSLRHMQRLVVEFKVTFTHNPPRRKRLCRPKIFLEEEVRALKEVVDDDPSLYLDEIQDSSAKSTASWPRAPSFAAPSTSPR
jgi:hypothetical protein